MWWVGMDSGGGRIQGWTWWEGAARGGHGVIYEAGVKLVRHPQKRYPQTWDLEFLAIFCSLIFRCCDDGVHSRRAAFARRVALQPHNAHAEECDRCHHRQSIRPEQGGSRSGERGKGGKGERVGKGRGDIDSPSAFGSDPGNVGFPLPPPLTPHSIGPLTARRRRRRAFARIPIACPAAPSLPRPAVP